MCRCLRTRIGAVGGRKQVRTTISELRSGGSSLAGRGGLFGQEHLDGFAVIEIGGHGREAGHFFGDAEAEGLHQQGFAGEVELHAGELPVVVADVGLLKGDGAAFVEAADDAPAEFNFRNDVGVEADEALVRGLDPDLASHAGEDLRLGIGRIEAWVRRIGEVVALEDGNRACGRRRERFAGNRDERWNVDGAGHD